MALSDARLLAPVQPPTVRDFWVFEQHIEGVRMGRSGDEPVPAIWYESLFCYFSNPHAVNGTGTEIPVPPGCVDLDFELEVAAVIGRPVDTSARRGGLRALRATRSSTIGRRVISSWPRCGSGLGICKGKDFANTLGPWIVTADELESPGTVTGSTSTCAPSSTIARSVTTRWPTWRGASRS